MLVVIKCIPQKAAKNTELARFIVYL